MKKNNHLFLKNFLFVCATLITVGCAQLSPQQVAFTPAIEAEGLISGTGTLSLKATDIRPSNVIGVRGGAYTSTSTITPKTPLTTVVESIARQILERGGFMLTDSLPDQALEIQIKELNFETTDQKASIKRNTAVAAISVVVEKGSVTYKNNYKTTQYIETLGYPSEAENEALLNDVFDSVLERMFRDPKLESFLQ